MAVRGHLFGAAGAVTAAAALAVLGLAAPGAAATSAAAPSGGTWGNVQVVLSAPAPSVIVSVSCASPGNCSAGGYMAGRARPGRRTPRQAMVVSQKGGIWGKAEEVPGAAALNTGGQASVVTVSCASPGNCSAGGTYRDHFGQQALVVSEKNGVWGTAEKVPGTGALNPGAHAVVNSVSCAAPGNCSAVGYTTVGFHPRGFVVSQGNGVWGKAQKVPGLAALSRTGFASVSAVSCAAAGNYCAAGGDYAGVSGGNQAFVVSEKNGRWGTALQIRGMGDVVALSCASAGDCSAGGGLFAVSEENGTWGKAEAVPGLAARNRGEFAGVFSVSCASAGNCSAGGSYLDRSGNYQGFVISQDNGVWGKAEDVPGLRALNRTGSATVNSLSCASPGDCSGGGSYVGHSGFQQGFVISQDNGTWGKAELLPSLTALNRGGLAGVFSVSCAQAGNCSAGGIYSTRGHGIRAFVVSQTS